MAARKSKRSNADLVKIGAVAVVVLAIGGVTLSELHRKSEETKATAALWTVTGPACPTPPAGTVVTSPAKGLDYEGLTFAREAGPINCNTIHENGTGPAVQVCMLVGPRNTRVTTPKGVFDYAPPPGENITIYVRDGQPSCITAINRAVTE